MHLETLTDAFVIYHQAMGHSEATIKHYQDSLKLLGRCLAEAGIEPVASNLTNQTMMTFAAWLRATPIRAWRGKSERSIWGVHGALKDIKAFVGWLVAEEYLDTAPKVPVPRLPQRLFPILSEDDLDRVFASRHLAGTSEMCVRNRALIAFMLDTGIRLAEAAGITLKDLDLKDTAARIRGKGNKERLVYYSEGVAEALRRWLTLRGEEDGALFWLERSGIRMLFKRIQTDVGLPVFTAHQLRHTAFTMLVKQNVDLHTIKRLAGHASVTTTEAYLALADADVKEKQRAASPFDHVAARLSPPRQARRRLRAR